MQMDDRHDRPNIHGVRPSQILADEARAFEVFRQKDLMPTKDSDNSTPVQVELYHQQLTVLGFTIGEVEDDLFMNVTFPPGWTKDADRRDPRHITIKDDKGRERINIFYKDTYYDRYASCSILTRYRTGDIYLDGQGNKTDRYTNSENGYYYGVRDIVDNSVIFEGTVLIKFGRGEHELLSRLEAEASKEKDDFLSANYPDCRNPLAYWD